MHPSGDEPRDLGQKPNRFAAWPKETCFQWYGASKLRKRVAFGLRVLNPPKETCFQWLGPAKLRKRVAFWGPCPQSVNPPKETCLKGCRCTLRESSLGIWVRSPFALPLGQRTFFQFEQKTCNLSGPCPQSLTGDVFGQQSCGNV